MLNIEQLDRPNKNLTYIIVTISIVISAVFLIIAEKHEKNPLLLDADFSLDFKLSADDIIRLIDSFETRKWVSVKLIQRQQKLYSVKLKHKPDSSNDYQLNMGGQVYNLFRYDKSRRFIYSFFQTAANWGLKSSTPQLVNLKFNEIHQDVYIIEEKIYQKLKDSNGNYFISLNGNSEKFNTLIHFIANQDKQAIENNFNKNQLASYLVFFSLFCYDEVLEFDNLLFFYDAQVKKYKPFLTLDSVFTSLEEQERSFKYHIGEDADFVSRLSPKNIRNLLARADQYKHQGLIEFSLSSLEPLMNN